jgi:hypothetical protein
MKYSGSACSECGLPMEACNLIASQRIEISRMRRALREIADDPCIDSEGNRQIALRGLDDELEQMAAAAVAGHQS